MKNIFKTKVKQSGMPITKLSRKEQIKKCIMMRNLKKQSMNMIQKQYQQNNGKTIFTLKQ